MIKRLARLLAVALLLTIALSFVLLNRDSVVVHLWGESSISAMAGVVFIGIFLGGFLLSAAGATFFGLQAYLRERKLKGQLRVQEAADESFNKACEDISCGEFSRAERELEGVIKRFPKHLSAYVELADLYSQKGDLSEAIKVIDRARSIASNNVRLLFTSAQLHQRLGNRTAAVDNLALVLFQSPNEKAARMARDLSEELNRVNDALEYSERLAALTDLTVEDKKILSRLRFKRISEQHVGDIAGEKTALLSFIKKESECVEAYLRLSEIESMTNNAESAAQYYVRAARINGDLALWDKAAQIWLKSGSPDRALAAARAAVKESSSERELISSNLQLARVYLELDLIDEAWIALEAINKLAHDLDGGAGRDQKQTAMIIAAACYSARGLNKDAQRLLFDVTRRSLYLPRQLGAQSDLEGAAGQSPAPRLSTP